MLGWWVGWKVFLRDCSVIPLKLPAPLSLRHGAGVTGGVRSGALLRGVLGPWFPGPQGLRPPWRRALAAQWRHLVARIPAAGVSAAQSLRDLAPQSRVGGGRPFPRDEVEA